MSDCLWTRVKRRTPQLTEWKCTFCGQDAYSNNKYAPETCRRHLKSGYIVNRENNEKITIETEKITPTLKKSISERMNRKTFAILSILLFVISVPINFIILSLNSHFALTPVYESFDGTPYTILELVFSFSWIILAIVILAARTLNAGLKSMTVIALPIILAILSYGMLNAPVSVYFVFAFVVMLFMPPRLSLRQIHSENSETDIIGSLERLNKLKVSGAISNEEYMLLKGNLMRDS